MRALAFTAPGRSSIVDVAAPTLSQGVAIVAPTVVGLCGTDLELYTGEMPYFAQGVAAYPIQPGHEVAGVVVDSDFAGLAPGTCVIVNPIVGCGRCRACAAGRATHCADRYEVGIRRGLPGGAGELVAIPIANLHRIPDGVSPRDAVLVEPGVTAGNAVRRLEPVRGSRGLVIGGGTLGLIAAQLLVRAGVDVDVLDPALVRYPVIEEIGSQPVERTEDAAYDLVIEAAGTAGAADVATRAVAPGGRVALVGVQPAPLAQFDINRLVLNDVSLIGVLNGPGLFDQLLHDVAVGTVRADVLVDSVYALEDAHAALERLCDRSRARPKVLLEIGQTAQ